MIDLTELSPEALDELFAANENDETIKAEYKRRGIDPDTGEPLEQVVA